MQFVGDSIVSGSMGDALPLAALLFEKDGTMNLVIIDKSSEEDVGSVRLVSDYFQYALNREDWMNEYAKVIVPDPPPDKKLHLRLVKSDKRDIN